jgi:tetratricopeptide (TPR) repeat protein
MTEPQRTDSARTPASADAERATRIEELLVSGLDHYFAEDYEQAINVWTRVVFLDRDHDRARAYIDRARKAIAERQRESEELLHRGLDAYKAGDVDTARDLLTRAVDQGAPSDEALVLLGRMDRLEGTGFDAPLHRRVLPARRMADESAPAERARRWRWAFGALVLAGVAAAVSYGAAPALSWLADVPPASRTTTQPPPTPLPLVRRADMSLDRARELYAGGHLHDALRSLDRIGIADPLRPEADRLRADIQRNLLAAASTSSPSTNTGTRQ